MGFIKHFFWQKKWPLAKEIIIIGPIRKQKLDYGGGQSPPPFLHPIVSYKVQLFDCQQKKKNHNIMQ